MRSAHPILWNASFTAPHQPWRAASQQNGICWRQPKLCCRTCLSSARQQDLRRGCKAMTGISASHYLLPRRARQVCSVEWLSAVYLSSGEERHASHKRHKGYSKVPDHEPGCNIQYQEVKENQEEIGVIWPQKSHLLNRAAQLMKIL